MPDSLNPMQQPQMIIEIRPFQGDGSVLKAQTLSRTGPCNEIRVP
jgi:hypothetical protein